jgi:hypothetical protein
VEQVVSRYWQRPPVVPEFPVEFEPEALDELDELCVVVVPTFPPELDPNVLLELPNPDEPRVPVVSAPVVPVVPVVPLVRSPLWTQIHWKRPPKSPQTR